MKQMQPQSRLVPGSLYACRACVDPMMGSIARWGRMHLASVGSNPRVFIDLGFTQPRQKAP